MNEYYINTIYVCMTCMHSGFSLHEHFSMRFFYAVLADFVGSRTSYVTPWPDEEFRFPYEKALDFKLYDIR